MTIADLAPNQLATITSVNNAGVLGERLMEMGFTPGASVQLIQPGRMGQPLQLRVRGYCVGLRRGDAQDIEVCV